MIRIPCPEGPLPVRCEGKLSRELNEHLHAMSQPMTVLLCALEYGAGLDSMQELKEMVRVSQEACERLRKSVSAMQAALREEQEESVGREHALE